MAKQLVAQAYEFGEETFLSLRRIIATRLKDRLTGA